MSIVALLPKSSQRILFKESVIEHMARHRQLSWYSREAGGQLFGSFTSNEVLVLKATGPYRGDQRGRSSYRSSPQAAQQAIDRQAGEGLFYLGEWHTHPEDHPGASGADLDAMAKMRGASSTRLDTLLMVIQGRSAGPMGLALYSHGPDGLIQWRVLDGHTPECR